MRLGKKHEEKEKRIIMLAGNPNVGKSTVFNALTGMKQHTGNWPGKTVESARGSFYRNGEEFVLADIPGTYSLAPNSAEETVARDCICFTNPDAVIIVADATCLERNLNLVLQILECGARAVLCVNLIDEAQKKGIKVDLEELSLQLGIPVVGTAARAGRGLSELIDQIGCVASGAQKMFFSHVEYDSATEKAIESMYNTVAKKLDGRMNVRWMCLKLLEGEESFKKSLKEYLGFDLFEDEEVSAALNTAKNIAQAEDADKFKDRIVGAVMSRCAEIFKKCVTLEKEEYTKRDRRMDKLLTSRATGIPIMLLGLGIIFWITIVGANYPSELLSRAFSVLGEGLNNLLTRINTPEIIRGPLVDGVYKTLSWVVSVMLPPMAIFFPMFTLLEDLGYLPRIAFNLDSFFKRAGAHGKQALTMCMGFGCNACGISGCRIIDSPRERLIGILTNNFVPCNRRFPILIAIITMFFTVDMKQPLKTVSAVVLLMSIIIFGICMTLIISQALSRTVLKGVPSTFALELPPYRRPQIGKVIIRSVFDRTIFVLGRAAAVAAPAGLVIWLLANISVSGESLMGWVAGALDPIARVIGLDGVILMACILALPANEIVFPIIIMSYLSMGSLTEITNLTLLRNLLVENGWTWVTAACTMLFSLCHFPCATALWTVAKETHSFKWTAASFLIPTACGVVICFIVASVARIFSLI